MSQEVWMTADTHFGHSNIIRHCNRPFQNYTEMDETLIQNFNSVIKPGDILYHLGDIAWSTFFLASFFGRLNTKNVHLILGNHDNKKPAEYRTFCSWVGELKKIKVNNIEIVLCHYPMRSWQNKSNGAYHAFGHCHGNLPDHDRSTDVGVDPNNYFPVHLDTFVAKLKDKPYFPDKTPV